MALSAEEILHLRSALQDAVIKCSERCLYQSAKWAAELLDSLPETDEADDEAAASEVAGRSPAISMTNPDADEAALEAKELGKYLLAKSLFDCKEFDRCAAVFLPEALLSSVLASTVDLSESGSTPSQRAKGKGKATRGKQTLTAGPLPKLSQRSLFLALYAKFMAGEKRKNEESEMILGPQDLGIVTNKQLPVVNKYLSAWFQERTAVESEEAIGSQGWLEYLYGIVLAKQKNDREAMDYFIRSVHKFPMNWGCWLEMTSLISRVEELNATVRHCPQNIISFMFHLNTSLELFQQTPSVKKSMEQLLSIFPTSSFLLTCRAMLTYHSKDLLLAEQHFSRLLAMHPYRLDSLDQYSNILYILTMRPKLAFLAHLCASVDKFRPETCVVIGNYYSLISMHEKSVQYFKRALTLDRSCLSAWTLMGHEYVEMKNSHAAIESYRRAVDVNRRDYRAWYGLGQTYEMLEMNTYSIWYYKKAAGLRPWDGKMWWALGSCLQKMRRYRDGIKALKRALMADAYYDAGSRSGSGGDLLEARGDTGHMDPDILLQIAIMYDCSGDEAEATAFMELCVAQEVGVTATGGGAAIPGLRDSISMRQDSSSPPPPPPSSEATAAAAAAASVASAERDESSGSNIRNPGGAGVTPATSKARMWLARHAMRHADYAKASKLATELYHDGFEVEEAKALVREARSRQDTGR